MLQNTDVFTDSLDKELKPHGTDAFPVAGYEEFYRVKGGYFLPWHWHEEMELIYIKDGRLSLQAGAAVCTLDKGEFMFINSNVLHSAKGFPSAVLESFVFSSRILTGYDSSVFSLEYLTPLIKSGLGYYIFRDESFIPSFERAFEALRRDVFGYEFMVRNVISTSILKVLEDNRELVFRRREEKKGDVDKVGLMLSYIYENYSKDITLSDLGKVCGISEREVLRQFRKTTGESPIQYTIKYKLLKSINAMSVSPDKPLSLIAAECGFRDAAYYTKKFKETYGETPRSYREKILKERDKRLFITE